MEKGLGEGVSTLLMWCRTCSVNEGDVDSGWREVLGRAAWDGVAMGTAACQEPCLQSRGAVRVWQVPEGGGWCMVCVCGGGQQC